MNANHPFSQLIRHPHFTKLWTSQILSQLTVNLVNFLILTRIFEATHSTIAVSLLWISWSLPALLFGPFSGAIVDNFSRRKMMIITNLLQAGVVALYLVLKENVFSLYMVVFLYSLLDQLYIPSQQASIPSLVGKNLLPAANGLFLLTQQASLLVGFGLGGIFLSFIGRETTIIASSILLLVAAIAVFLLPKDSTKDDEILQKDLGEFWQELSQGYEFVKSNRSVLFPLIMIISAQIFISIIAIILPTYARNVLNTDLNHSAALMIIPGGLGALGITYFLPKLIKKYRKKYLIESGLLIGGISLMVMAFLPVVAVGRLVLALIISVSLGISIATVLIPSQTLLQEKTPSWFRGRVYGSLGFLMTIATSIPLLLAATTADLLGVDAMIFGLSAILIFGFIILKVKGDSLLQNNLFVTNN